MLCIFIFNLREILQASGCQQMLSHGLCSVGEIRLAFTAEVHGAELIWETRMDSRLPQPPGSVFGIDSVCSELRRFFFFFFL